MPLNVLVKKQKLVMVSSAALALSASISCALAQVPLGEKIRDDGSTVRGDQSRLRRDEAKIQRAQESTQEYLQSTEQWIQQNDAQIQDTQSKLNALEAGIKSKTTLAKLLNTPGNQFYVLKTLLQKEMDMKAQAEANIQTAQQNLAAQQSAVQQDRYQINADRALMRADQGSYRDEMDRYYDLVRQKNDARYMGDRIGRHRGRYFTGYDQAAYDAGRHPIGLGNPYWGLRSNEGGFQGR
ncbi:MAG TPA: hypothetical protein V6D17_05260 [Candidatus Obscuribacterales bacterium]